MNVNEYLSLHKSERQHHVHEVLATKLYSSTERRLFDTILVPHSVLRCYSLNNVTLSAPIAMVFTNALIAFNPAESWQLKIHFASL